MSQNKEKTFESTLEELEKTVAALEGNINLEEALELFEKGMELSESCENYLAAARQRIEQLRRKKNGTLFSTELE